MKTVGSLIKSVRRNKNVSQQELVRRAKRLVPKVQISQTTISAIENNQTHPSPEQQAAIGLALNSIEVIWNYYENKEIRDAADNLLEKKGLIIGIDVIGMVSTHIAERLAAIKDMTDNPPGCGTKEYYIWLAQLREHADWIRLNSDALWLFIGNPSR